MNNAYTFGVLDKRIVRIKTVTNITNVCIIQRQHMLNDLRMR